MNDLCHHPSDPALLASVGDDGHCRLWDLTKGQMRSKFRLGSPGVDVKWHPQDPFKVSVPHVSIIHKSTKLNYRCKTIFIVNWSYENENVYIHTVNVVRGHSYEKFSTQKFIIRKFHNAKISRSTVFSE